MKLTTTAFGTFALIAAANAAVTGHCTPGLNYCSRVLEDVGGNHAAIADGLTRDGYTSAAQYPVMWNEFLFHCNNDQSISVVGACYGSCRNNGSGQSDTCA
ncbi:uncharacterized protein AlacWU_07405 [Aspergillus niger]|uniref:Contig An01c0070, genomic contig n=3 Tax=Aspergillus niger TaxID=5061 RepID=A2Q7P5_ASPNC|nr:uncharacterized protein BO96DRAFT_485169 [Aspergillus niger CBS 101883]XP_059603067.1 uncharacterized protein An01g01460 [Aspergillus niger]RDH19814.1 hypothetical protein M747DRAFT_342090 [Aspergillus niger ATCC 13496]PYH52316.1 hypothetical protein BO96DRAFT_485169 [Aspergillus niger CBS 101883]CAK43518.1 unnamed protein product [Aspergillus niger]GJP94506.1 uncharacterized protein AlacWU_07405 [Aspergillus niger]